MTKNTIGIHPLGLMTLIKIKKPNDKTEGGIILPDQIRDDMKYRTRHGELLAMGSNAFRDEYGEFIPDRPKEGDFVLIDEHAGHEIKIKDSEDIYRVVSTDEIRAVLDKDSILLRNI
jgi:chaperonin GroES